MHSEIEQRAYRLGWLRATNPNGWEEQDDITSGDAIFDSQMFDDLGSDYPCNAAPKVASDTGAITPEWCLRMAELEAGQEIGAGAPDHPLRTKCELPPAGWVCTREPGHDGPCATVASDTGAGLREALRWIEEQCVSLVGDEAENWEIFARIGKHAAAALATPTDATDGATGGGQVRTTYDFDMAYNGGYWAGVHATTPGGDLLEQAARVAEDEAEGARVLHNAAAKDKDRDGTNIHGEAWRVGKQIAARIRALKPAGDGGEA